MGNKRRSMGATADRCAPGDCDFKFEIQLADARFRQAAHINHESTMHVAGQQALVGFLIR